MIVEKLDKFMEHHVAYLLHNLPQINSRMTIQILVKISHITMDYVISPASDRIILGIGPQLCIVDMNEASFIQHHAAYLLHNLPQIISKMVMNSGQNKPQHHGFCYIFGL